MWFHEQGRVIDDARQKELMQRTLDQAADRIQARPKRVLLLPPDLTRYHSGAGQLTNWLYHMLGPDCEIDLIPTLGQHVPHTPEENRWMFGDIPEERIHAHDWKRSCATYGEVSAEFVRYATDGRVDWPIPVQIHRAVKEGNYDLVINIGQVVPHEVLGFANHNKNYFIGLGGKDMICASHMMAATCGIEDNLGQIITPLRGCYNVAERDYLAEVPDLYILIVKTRDEAGDLNTTGLYVGEDVDTYVAAARYAREHTVFLFDRSLPKVVCAMDGREFKSTWVGNKAIYRTRKVVADGGELVVIAPGVERFGEQDEVDRMIRKYGYKGTPHTLAAYKADPELQDLGHAAAHLIHGSSEGRFTITYAPGKLGREDVEGVGLGYLPLEEALAAYDPDALKDGFNTVDGEEVYFISSPSLGLWSAREKFLDSLHTNLAFAERMAAREPDEPVWQQLIGWNREDLDRYAQ